MPHFGDLQPDGTVTNERFIDQRSIRACPHVILMPSHYNEDESCRCKDPEHKEMEDWGYRWNGERWA